MASIRATSSTPSRRWLGRALWAFLALSVAGAATLAVSWSVLSRDADSFLTLFALRVPKTITKVLDHDGNVIGIFAEEHRVVIPYGDIPKAFVNALIATEDSDFWGHSGVSARGLMRSGWNFVTSFGRRREGASTLTMQLIRTVTAKRQKRLDRKLKEIILARKLERAYSKKQILEMYANEVYFGGGRYGIEAAAEFYFGKSAPQLNVEECALLAGLVQNPNWYNPYNPDPKARAAAKARRNHVLLRMVKEDYLKPQEASLLIDKPIRLARENAHEEAVAPYVVEEVRKYLYEKYGREQVLNGGLEVTTTVDSFWQEAANEAVRNGLKAVDKRQGFRGPIDYLSQEQVDAFCKKVEDGIDTAALKTGETYQGVVTAVNPAKGEIMVRVGDRTGVLGRKNMAWAGKVKLLDSYGRDSGAKGKSIPLGAVIEVSVVNPDVNKTGAVFALDQEPLAQAALVAVDPRSGAVRAMVGGYDFRKSQFNRALQAKRNPGSAFKPIIYAAALDKGMTPATIIDDSQVEYVGGGENAWKPKNYDNIYRGPVTMREALTNSINVVSVKILENIGVNYAIDYAKKLGITSPLSPNLTLALGSSSVTPIELTSAYAVFASGGYRVTPYFITKVVDGEGKVLEEYAPPVVPVFSSMSSARANEDDGPVKITDMGAPAVPANAPVQVISPETSYIMTNLMQSVVSSGTGQRAKAVGRPVAGKTGTTNDMKDAWFVGYVPQLVAGVWVGYDQERSLGAGGSGGQAAAPIWTEFMQRAVAGAPVQSFKVPADVAFALINPRTGRLAKGGSSGAVQECFIAGTEPKDYDEEAPRVFPENQF